MGLNLSRNVLTRFDNLSKNGSLPGLVRKEMLEMLLACRYLL